MDEQALAAYFRQGYHIEENVFSSTECEQLIAEAMQQAKVDGNHDYRVAMMIHRHNPKFLEVMRKPKIVETIRMLVQGEASGLQSEFFYSPPGVRGFATHQDNFFVQAPEDAFASAWTALVDTDKHNGGLYAYPGTHLAGTLPVRDIQVENSKAQDPNANNTEVVVPDQYQAVDLVVPKGGVLFIHANLVHASHINQSDEWRYVILNTYIRSGEAFRPGNYACREEIPL